MAVKKSGGDASRTQPSVLPNKVGAWLTGKGFPLELRVARGLERRGLRVQPNRFVDVPGLRRPREIDVLAVVRRDTALFRAQFELYVECKWSRANPWAVFTSHAEPPTPSTILPAVPANAMGEALLWLLQDSEDLAKLMPFGSAGTFAYGGRRTLGATGRSRVDPFYSAMQSVTTIARAGVTMQGSHSAVVNPELDPAFAFPVVVVDAPLYAVSLADDADDLVVQPIERARVLWRGVRAQNLSCVDLVQASALDSFADDCVKGLKEAFDRLSNVHNDVAAALRKDSPDPMSHWFRDRVVSPPIRVPTLLRALASKYATAVDARRSDSGLSPSAG